MTKEAIASIHRPFCKRSCSEGQWVCRGRTSSESLWEPPHSKKGRRGDSFSLQKLCVPWIERNRSIPKIGSSLENKYYLFIPEDPEMKSFLRNIPLLSKEVDSYWFISFDHMKELKKEDLLILRAGDIAGIYFIGLLIVSILVVHFGLNFLQVYAMEVAGQKMVHDLRMKLFSHLQSLSVSFFDKNPVGRLVTRLTNDIQNVHEMFTLCARLPFQGYPSADRDHRSPSLPQLEFALVSFSLYPSDLCHHPFLQPSGKGRVSRDSFEDCTDECFFPGKFLRHKGGADLSKGTREWPDDFIRSTRGITWPT